jgi:hypothetical protein
MCDQFFTQHRCAECDSRPVIRVKDEKNPQTYVAKNPAKKFCCKIRVDGCLITGSEKCDFLVLNCADRNAFFIELKGSDLPKACRQIHRSIEQLVSHLKGFKIYGRVVLNRVRAPDTNSTEEKKLKKLLKQYNQGKEKRELFAKKVTIMEEEV